MRAMSLERVSDGVRTAASGLTLALTNAFLEWDGRRYLSRRPVDPTFLRSATDQGADARRAAKRSTSAMEGTALAQRSCHPHSTKSSNGAPGVASGVPTMRSPRWASTQARSVARVACGRPGRYVITR